MNFSYNENQKMIADMIRQFGRNNITPFVREWDDKQYFPIDVLKKLGELGLMVYWFLTNTVVQVLHMMSMLPL